MAKLLLIEDDEIVRELLAMRLELAGHEPYEASDGHEGLTRLREETFDLILLDMLMPSMSGLQFLESAVKGLDLLPPVIVLSATRVDEDIKPFVERCQTLTVIRKPVGIDKILSLVDEALAA